MSKHDENVYKLQLEKLKKDNGLPLRTTRFEDWELAFIKANYLKMTDKQLASELRRNLAGISKKRKDLGLVKGNGRPNNDKRKFTDQQNVRGDFRSGEYEIVREEYKKLTKDQKKKLFQSRFEHTKRYQQLQETLDEDELDFYTERYLDYINTWETLLTTEEDTLHLAITELIRANRMLKRQKEMRDENKEIPIDLFDRQYKECVQTYSKLMGDLSGTRQQRLNTNREEKLTLDKVVQGLQDEEIRRKAGKEAAIIEAAKKATATNMRTKNYLID